MDRIDGLSLRELADYPLVLRESGSKTRENPKRRRGNPGFGRSRILMEEALICLRESPGGKLIGAFMDMAKEPVTRRRTAPRVRSLRSDR